MLSCFCDWKKAEKLKSPKIRRWKENEDGNKDGIGGEDGVMIKVGMNDFKLFLIFQLKKTRIVIFFLFWKLPQFIEEFGLNGNTFMLLS